MVLKTALPDIGGRPRTTESRQGDREPPSASAFITRYWVENSASMNSRCLVGATRTTSRRSRPSLVLYGTGSSRWRTRWRQETGRRRLLVLFRPVTSRPATGSRWRRLPRGRAGRCRARGGTLVDGRVTGLCPIGGRARTSGTVVTRCLRLERRDSVAWRAGRGRSCRARYLNDAADFTRLAVALEGEGDLAAVVRQSGRGRRAKDAEHVVFDPVALPRWPGQPPRGLGRGLFRHVRVRRREGVDGGRRGVAHIAGPARRGDAVGRGRGTRRERRRDRAREERERGSDSVSDRTGAATLGVPHGTRARAL